MTGKCLAEELGGAITAGVPLPQVVSTLRTYQNLGVARQEVQSALEALRSRAPDETTEDRILEIMDIVSGFCSPHMKVWDD